MEQVSRPGPGFLIQIEMKISFGQFLLIWSQDSSDFYFLALNIMLRTAGPFSFSLANAGQDRVWFHILIQKSERIRMRREVFWNMPRFIEMPDQTLPINSWGSLWGMWGMQCWLTQIYFQPQARKTKLRKHDIQSNTKLLSASYNKLSPNLHWFKWAHKQKYKIFNRGQECEKCMCNTYLFVHFFCARYEFSSTWF